MPVVNENDFSCLTCKHYKEAQGQDDGECRQLDPREAALWTWTWTTLIPVATVADTWCGRWERAN